MRDNINITYSNVGKKDIKGLQGESQVYFLNLLIDAAFLPLNVHAVFELDLYGIKVRGMTKRMCRPM